MWKLQDFYLKFPLLIKVIPNVCVFNEGLRATEGLCYIKQCTVDD